MTRFSWTQPCCLSCWEDRNPGRRAVTLVEPTAETCVYCGSGTGSGIYVRVDPNSDQAGYPTLVKS